MFLTVEAKVYPSQLISKGDIKALQKAFNEKQIDINSTCGSNTPMIVCAVQDDQIKVIDFLLSKGVDIAYTDERGQSLLHLAAFDDNLTTIKYLESKGLDLDLKDTAGETLLHNAVFSGNLEITKYMFSKGIADINTTDSYGNSLFYTACKNSHLEVIKYLISQGVDVNEKLGSFSSVFIVLESYYNIENVFATLKYLVSIGVDVSDPVLLEVATRTSKLESLKYLLKKQNLQNDAKTIKKLLKISAKSNRTINIAQYLMAKVTFSKDELDALLAISIENRKLKMAKYLISMGADVNAKDKYNNPIIFSSISDKKVFKFLIKNGFDYRVFNNRGETILHHVIQLSSITSSMGLGDYKKKFRMFLLKDYFSINILDDNNNTLLHAACHTNNIAMIDYFLDNNLSMSKTNKLGETPLHYAMKYSDEKTLIHIIEKYTHLFKKIMLNQLAKGEEDNNFTRWAKYSPVFFKLISPLISQEKKEKLFYLTILNKNYFASKILVQDGVDVNLQDKDKNTILHHLSYSKEIALLRWFLENSANRYIVNLQNETPLHIAVSENNLEFTKCLLDENIQLSKRYTNGRSILHETIKTQNLEMLKLITSYVKDMNMQDDDGNTALHLAAKTSSLEILKYLVLEKYDLSIKNNFNVTPSMLITKREDLNKKELSTFMNISATEVQTVIKPYVFFNHDAGVVTLMSDKRKFILSNRYDNSIYIWDVKNFREIKKLTLKEAPGEIQSIPNSTYVALKSKGKISIYDIYTEEYVVTFNIDKLRDFKVSSLGNKIYALGDKDKLFHIDFQNKSMIEDKNMVSYISSSSKLGVGKDEQLVALRYDGIEIYDFKQEITTKYVLPHEENYEIRIMRINEENDILILDQQSKYNVKPKKEKRDIYIKKDNAYVKLKTIQSADTLSTHIAFDKKNTILYVLDHNKSKLRTYSKKNHFKEESTDIPTELMHSNIMFMNDQIIFANNPQYGSLKVSLFDLKTQKIVSSKETSSEDISYNLFVKHFDYKRSKLNNQKLYQEYYYNYNAYDKLMERYTLITNKDGSKLIKNKGHRVIKEGADGKVIYTLDTEHKYYLQYQIDEKSNLMTTWSETTALGPVHSDNFITLIDTKKGSIKKKINVERLADFGFIDKYLYSQSYRKMLPKKGNQVLIPGPISLYDMNTGEYIKRVDIPNVNLKINDISENFPYISFTEKINDQTFINILDLETEKIIIKLETEDFPNSSFSKDNIFVYVNPMGKVVLFDLIDKKELYVFEDIEERVYHSFFIGENIIGFLVDTGKFVLYDLHSKKKLVDIFTFKDSWIMITPESYFTGGGTFADKLTFLDGYQNIYDTHQLYDHFFRPDIVKLKLYGEDISKFIKDNTLHNALKNPPPKLAFKSIDSTETKTSGFDYDPVETKKEKVNLSFAVKEHDGGGVGLMRVYQEGKLIQTIGEGKVNKQSANVDAILEQEKLDSTLKANQKTYIASLSKSIQGNISIEDTIAKVQSKTTTNQSGTYDLELELKSGKNEISIEAFNKTNTVTSYRENITINANIPKQKPKLYAIVAGVNKFEAPSVNNLKYSQNDAQTIKEAAEKKMNTVFDDVEVIYLTGKEVTKDNILKAAQDISKKAKLDDTVLFYISTHGRAARGKLYLVPYNNKSVKNWIDFEQTFQAVQSIKALNQIFVIDACESGKANDIVSSVYDSRASVLAKSSGVHMLLATTKGTSAFEHPDPTIKNGVFTHRILQAMRDNTTDANKDSLISILELSKKLKEPSNNADYQYPVIRNVGKDVELERVK